MPPAARRRSRSPLALGALAWALQTGRSMLAPDRRRARRLAGARRPRRARRPHAASARPALAEALRRAAQPAARRLGQGAGPRRPRRHASSAIAAITAWAVEDIRAVRPGESFAVGRLRARASTASRRRARPELHHRDAPPSTVLRGRPRGRRRSTPRSASTTCRAWRPPRPAIDRGLTRDLYVALGDPQAGRRLGAAHLRQALRQLDLGSARCSWPLGGVVSLTDRRYRVGAPARRAAPAAAVPAE